jgi:aspartyl-tRNA(Asn)/glutamyl-tRNA(Gln) amidotransferase subunit C
MLTIEDISHIAKLAKLDLSEEELGNYLADLNSIVDYIGKLSEVNTDNVEPTFHPIRNLKNRFQEDGMDDALSISEVTRNAKEKKDNYILTEAVL